MSNGAIRYLVENRVLHIAQDSSLRVYGALTNAQHALVALLPLELMIAGNYLSQKVGFRNRIASDHDIATSGERLECNCVVLHAAN